VQRTRYVGRPAGSLLREPLTRRVRRGSPVISGEPLTALLRGEPSQQTPTSALAVAMTVLTNQPPPQPLPPPRMRRCSVLVLLLATICTVSACASHFGPGTAVAEPLRLTCAKLLTGQSRIALTFLDEYQHPLPGVVVRLRLLADGSRDSTFVSDPRGQVILSNVAIGERHELTIQLEGYLRLRHDLVVGTSCQWEGNVPMVLAPQQTITDGTLSKGNGGPA
jgi:hypothetical protein